MSRLGAAATAAAAAFAIATPFFLKPFGIFLISMWAVLTIAAMGLNLTLGYAGQVSLAQGAFVGIGAYTVALLTQAGCPSRWRSSRPGPCVSPSAGFSAIRRCAFRIITSPSSRSRSRLWCSSCCATSNG